MSASTPDSDRSCHESGSFLPYAEKVYATGHTMVGAALVFRGVVIPLLFDAYYLCPTVTRACQHNGFRYVGVAKKNRKLFPDGRPRDKRRLDAHLQTLPRVPSPHYGG